MGRRGIQDHVVPSPLPGGGTFHSKDVVCCATLVEFANCTVAEIHFLGLDCNMAALEHHWVWQELTLSCKPAEFKELQTRVPEALGTHPREYSHLDPWEGLHTKQDSSNGNTKLAP